MISYLGSLVQFSPAAGRAGRCRQISLCVGSTPRVPATLGLPRTGVSVLSPSTLLRLPTALYGAGPALSAVPVFRSSTKAWIRLRLRVVSSPPQRFRQPKAWAPSSGRGAPFPSVASSSGSQRLARTLPRCGAPFPSAASGPGSQRFGRPRARRAFSLCGKPLRQPEACAHSTPCGRSFPSAAPARAAGRVSGSL